MAVKVVAEIGINHNGCENTAMQLINVAKMAGCDYVKFQKRTIDLVYTKTELSKYRESPWGTTNREQKEGLEFKENEYDLIRLHCKKQDIEWFASPWDTESVVFLAKFSMPYIKVASASITNLELLEVIRGTNIPVILSTGMSTKKEVDRALDLLRDRVEYLLACTSTYPTPAKEVNLSFICTLKREYPQFRIGFSNHSPSILFCAAAVALGAEMIEFHLTLDRTMYGSDQAASIETTGAIRLCKYIRNLEMAMGLGRWIVFDSEEEIKTKLRKGH